MYEPGAIPRPIAAPRFGEDEYDVLEKYEAQFGCSDADKVAKDRLDRLSWEQDLRHGLRGRY